VAKRLDWEKEAKRLKVKRDGADFAYDELPSVGTYSDKTRYLEQKGYKQAETRKIRSKRKSKVPVINKTNASAMREALEAIQRELVAVFERENSRLMGSDIWQKLSSQQKHYLRQRFDLNKPLSLAIATEEEINSTLREGSLAKRRNLVAQKPRHFQSALEEANRLLALDGRFFPKRK
jgi:hypothetical protein